MPDSPLAVLVASTDAYADVWPVFFALFDRYWGDCPYPVYLGSNVLTYGDVRALAVGEDVDWSSSFAAMLDGIEEPYVLVLLEDYLLTGAVDRDLVARLFDYAVRRDAACLRLMPVPGAPAADAAEPLVGELPRGMPYRVSLQAAIWKRGELRALLRPGESAWEFELRGTPRSDALDGAFLSIVAGGPRPLPYFITGLSRGVWQRDALRMLRREGLPRPTGRGREPLPTFLRRRGRWWRAVLAERVKRT